MKQVKFPLIILQILLPFVFCAQGNYSPIGADFSYPRTIIDRQEIPEVRNSLENDSLKKSLYKIIINAANATVPVGNESYNERFGRASIARESAFVLLMNRKIVNDEFVPLTNDDSIFYLTRTIDLLENLNDSVGFGNGFLFYWEWQLRSPELMNYLIAYDLLKGSDIPDSILISAKNRVYQFSGNFYERTSEFYPNPIFSAIPLEFYSYKVNNHAIISCSTIGLAAIVLGDETNTNVNLQPHNWMQAAMYNLDNVLWQEGGINPRVSEKGRVAGYAEGPNYFQYAFKNALPFIRSMWNFLPDDYRDYTFNDYNGFLGTSTTVTRNIRNPWYDENYHNIYEWMNRIRMPDGRYPAIHDSARGFRTMATALSGISRYNIPNPKSNYNSIWVRSQFISTLVDDGVYDEPLFQALPAAGSLVFRSEYNNPEAVYMHLIGKHDIALLGAKGHHQADATSFQIYFNQEDLALDPGYSGSNYRGDVEKATDHNLILVNGNGPSTPINEFVVSDNSTYIEIFFDMPSIDYGELRSAYQETDITRKVLFLNNKYFILTDFVRSNNLNDYTFQLHGYGLENAAADSTNGAFVSDFSNFRGTYTRNNSNLLAHITSRGLTNYSSASDSLSLGANGYQEYTKTLVHENAYNTEFLAILFPHKTQQEPIISTIMMNGEVNAHAILTPESKDLIFIQPNDTLSEIPTTNFNFSENVSGNGNVNFVSFDLDDNFKNLFVENGSAIAIGNKEIFKSDLLVDLVLEKDSYNSVIGYVSEASTIEIYSDSSLIVEYGEISDINYDEINKKTILTFSEGSYFKLVEGEILINNNNNNILPNQFSMKLFPNPANSHSVIQINNSLKPLDGVITLFDVAGKVLFEKNVDINTGKNTFSIPLESLPEGLFIVNLKTEVNHLVKKLNVIRH